MSTIDSELVNNTVKDPYVFDFINLSERYKEKDKITANYSLKDVNKPIRISSYQLSNIIPKNILDQLPTEEELNLYIDIE